MVVKNRLTMSEGLDSHPRREDGLGFMYVRLISWLVIAACSGQQAALHGNGGLAESSKRPDKRIPPGWKIERQGVLVIEGGDLWCVSGLSLQRL